MDTVGDETEIDAKSVKRSGEYESDVAVPILKKRVHNQHLTDLHESFSHSDFPCLG